MILFPFHISPCPVLSAIASQLFTARDLLRFVTAKILFVLETYDSHSAPDHSCVRNVPTLFTHQIIRHETLLSEFVNICGLIGGIQRIRKAVTHHTFGRYPVQLKKFLCFGYSPSVSPSKYHHRILR
jgi:hypothetical protein